MLLIPIMIFVWSFAPAIKYERSSMFNLVTKAIMFSMLAICSLLFCSFTVEETNFPSFFPESIRHLDQTFGFLCSYLVIPLLVIAEDRIDYSQEHSISPQNSAQSYSLFVKYNSVIRYVFGLVICLTMATGYQN